MSRLQSTNPSKIDDLKKMLTDLTANPLDVPADEEMEANKLIEKIEVFKKNRLTPKNP